MTNGRSPQPIATVGSVSDFLNALKRLTREEGRFLMFRGQRREDWRLLPTIMRADAKLINAEKDISREIISQYPHEFDHDETMFDKLCRMQHFGIATRLLDITQNPLVALYFASECNIDDPTDCNGAVIALEIPQSRKKYYDSDAISCISNLSNLTYEEKELLSKTSARTISEFNELKPTRRLIQFIRAEKPYFLPEIRREDLHIPYIAIPKLRNRRIISQQGAFMTFGLDRNDGPKYSKNISAKTIIINSDKKQEIRKELDSLGINTPTLFPEIDQASRYIMHKYSK